MNHKAIFQKLCDVIEYAEEELEFNGKEGTERLVSTSTGAILLTPDELREIKELLP